LRLGWLRHILDHSTAGSMAEPSAPRRVLLVDDEPDQVEMYQLALEFAGFEVIAAFNGKGAVESARAHAPAAIVLDLRLPDMSGWEVCKVLKSDARTADIPVVILTAAASLTLPQLAKAAGCAAHLIKPCFPDRLARTLADVISGRSPSA
jgi:adenylate cyclase